jgi:Flp pilus assembly protein TadG
MRRQREKGSALVEAALAFTILIPVFLGTFQFGLAFFYYNELANAVRAGARYASYRTYDSPTLTPSAAYVNAVRNMTVYGNPAGGTQPVVRGLTPAHVSVTVISTNLVPQRIRVSINRFPMNVVLKTFNVSKPEAVFPHLGVYAPAS